MAGDGRGAPDADRLDGDTEPLLEEPHWDEPPPDDPSFEEPHWDEPMMAGEPQSAEPQEVPEEEEWLSSQGSFTPEDVKGTPEEESALLRVGPVVDQIERINAVNQRTPGGITPSDYFFIAFCAVNGIDLRWNVRAMRVEYRATAGPQGDWQTTDGKWTAWSDRFESSVLCHITRNYDRTDTEKDKRRKLNYTTNEFARALHSASHRNEVDPFLEWIESLPQWDGTNRCEFLLSSIFGIESEDPLHMWASRYPFVGALQRSYDPGSKIDEFPVLVSGQGTGKSAFVKSLVPDQAWFGDSLDLSATVKEQAEALAGRVIVEVSEMVGSGRADIEKMKSFLTRTDDGQHRAAYARSPEPRMRRCVFVGTANDSGSGVLPNDPTGNRRFVVIETGRPEEAVEGQITPIMEQLWAEVREKRNTGETGFTDARLPRNLLPVAAKINEIYRRSDTTVEDAIEGLDGSEPATLDDICRRIRIHDSEGPVDRQTQDRVARALRARGWEKKYKKVDGKSKRVWYNPNAIPENENF